ncbi:MAG: hypothetical protein IKY34_05760 [Ruminiclostridium sp.]|nr:hypothetical protein [Ruminiclostridium sp.]
MHDLFQTVLLLSGLGGGLGLILLCLKPLLVRWVPPRWQTWLWGLALVVMVLPVYQWVPVSQPAPAVPVIQPQAQAVDPPAPAQTEENTPTVSPAPQEEPVPAPHPQRFSPAHLSLLWLAGVGAFLAFLLGNYGRFLFKIHRKSNIFPEHPLVEDLCRELNIRRTIPLRVVPELPTPMLVGPFFPVVCLPDPDLPQEHLRMILLHELTHYKRKDLLLKWLALLVNALHWFNPLAWLLTRNLGQACEDACDRDVTWNMTPQERKQYMYTILTLAQR